jgi:hypothetical protein
MRLSLPTGVILVALSASCSTTGGSPEGSSGSAGSGGGDAGGLGGSAGGGGGIAVDSGCHGENSADDDDDGWTEGQGDCDDCDARVNPGALDFSDNEIDDDCNGEVDDHTSECDGPLAIDSQDARDFARAIGLCKFTVEQPEPQERTWGVIDARFNQADGASTTDAMFSGVLLRYGPNNAPRQGKQMLALSSGTARGPNDPGAYNPNGGGYARSDLEVPCPAGFPKNAGGCPTTQTSTANDSARLDLRIRVPTNAHSLKFAFDFFTAEYPEWICSEYNDTFVALLETGASLDPAHHGNISFDEKGNPISVNVSFFDVVDGPLLAGTWQAGGLGGATGWLATQAPVVPGEVIELSFAIWDTGDHAYDSLVLIDGFDWSVDAPDKPTTVPTPR